jgi:hypothetical protein
MGNGKSHSLKHANVFNLCNRPRSTKDGMMTRKGGEGERSSSRTKNHRFYSMQMPGDLFCTEPGNKLNCFTTQRIVRPSGLVHARDSIHTNGISLDTRGHTQSRLSYLPSLLFTGGSTYCSNVFIIQSTGISICLSIIVTEVLHGFSQFLQTNAGSFEILTYSSFINILLYNTNITKLSRTAEKGQSLAWRLDMEKKLLTV